MISRSGAWLAICARGALPPEVYALWRQARMVVAEARGVEVTDADFLETLCRNAIAPGSGAEGPAHQIAYKQCPDCRHVTQNGAGREIDVAPEVIERASCDAKLFGSLDAATPERATTTVTPRLREQVFARDSTRCTAPGCRAARNLEAHHIIEQARGGPHTLSNLTLVWADELSIRFLRMDDPASRAVTRTVTARRSSCHEPR